MRARRGLFHGTVRAQIAAVLTEVPTDLPSTGAAQGCIGADTECCKRQLRRRPAAQGRNTMTTVQITLPDALAQEATSAGLLAPEKIERIVRDRLHADRIERMKTSRAMLVADPIAPMTAEEISAEIEAYRSEQRRAAGS